MTDSRDTIPLPKPINIYPKRTQSVEKRLFNDCMKVKDSRIAWLIETAGILGIDKSKLDFTPDSLVILWRGLIPYVKRVKPRPFDFDLLPEWFGVDHASVGSEQRGGYDLLSIWLLDALAYYYGETLIRNIAGLEWQLSNVSPKWAVFGLPHIRFAQETPETANFETVPFYIIQGAFSSTWVVRDDGVKCVPDSEEFKKYYLAIMRNLSTGGYRKTDPALIPNIAAPLPEAFEFGIEQNDDDADYPYHVWFFEGTEYELGIKTFNSLRKRFAAIDGIKKVIHEDREVFLIKSDLAIETLKERIWATFCQACAEVVANKQAQAEARAAKRAAAKAAKLAKQ